MIQKRTTHVLLGFGAMLAILLAAASLPEFTGTVHAFGALPGPALG